MISRRNKLGALFVILLAITSCRKHDDEKSRARPATVPTTAPSTVPTSTTRPLVPSSLSIDGKRHEFPPARLQILKKESGLTLVLYTDETPPTTTQPSTRATDENTFYFQMALNVDDLDDLPSTRWRYTLQRDATNDRPDGIFIVNSAQISPTEAEATFQREGDEIIINLRGKFADLSAPDAATFQVVGRLAACRNDSAANPGRICRFYRRAFRQTLLQSSGLNC
jgi:hypothetical protein